MAIKRWVKLLLWSEDVWRHWRIERLRLTERCLRLEARLIEAEHERDDWQRIAQALGRGLE